MKKLKFLLLIPLIYLISYLITVIVRIDSNFVLREEIMEPNWFTLPSTLILIIGLIIILIYIIDKLINKK